MIPLKDNIGFKRVPIAVIALILANVVVYLVAALHAGWGFITGPSEQTVLNYGAIPYEFSHWGQHCAIGLAGFGQGVLCSGQPHVGGTAGPQPPTWETAFTAMFLHANVLQLAVNMVFLAAFGPSLEYRVGSLAFLGLYVLGGLVALALQVAVAAGSAVPLLGASGSVATVLGAYVVVYPRARIVAVVMRGFSAALVEVSAWLMIAAWFALDLVIGAVGLSSAFGGGAGVAYYAHWGGFAFGLLVALALVGRADAHSRDEPLAS